MPEDLVKKESAFKKSIKLFIKLAITALCFWYISTKIEVGQLWQALLDADFIYLVIALILLIVSKIFSAFRLNIYFRNIGLSIPEWVNAKLYWLGMFYNLFLPGAISGDAYKVILLKKKVNAPYRKTSAAVLLDRFSGLLSIGILVAITGVIIFPYSWVDFLLTFGALSAIVILFFIVKWWFKDFIPGYWPAFFWGMAVQLTQVLCVFCIMKALHVNSAYIYWLFIFLSAAVISVLPISLGGGLGTREFVFVTAAGFFMLDEITGLTISLLFFAISVVASAGGAYFIFQDPLKDNQTQSSLLSE